MPELADISPRQNASTIRSLVGDLYHEHHPWLSTWLGKKMGCSYDAADLSHDTFLKLINSKDVANLREPRAYLLVIANRLMINRYRRKSVEKEVLQQVALIVEDSEKRGPAEVALSQDLLAKILSLLIEELPEKPRRAFLMARVDGMTYSQIAKKLNVSQSSVKQYLAKVLAHFHARLYSLEQLDK